MKEKAIIHNLPLFVVRTSGDHVLNGWWIFETTVHDSIRHQINDYRVGNSSTDNKQEFTFTFQFTFKIIEILIAVLCSPQTPQFLNSTFSSTYFSGKKLV
ncbi:hypothetical protein RB195_003855 [Necator americanus]|uniref:Uncharacterized protein n=1 Tax=Necator americanus TaxID=51031 RepID=A0ABR1DR79_NECAM